MQTDAFSVDYGQYWLILQLIIYANHPYYPQHDFSVTLRTSLATQGLWVTLIKRGNFKKKKILTIALWWRSGRLSLMREIPRSSVKSPIVSVAVSFLTASSFCHTCRPHFFLSFFPFPLVLATLSLSFLLSSFLFLYLILYLCLSVSVII